MFDTVGLMTSPTKTVEDWELLRRSVAMLPPGAWGLRREQALEALAALVDGLRRERHSHDTDHRD
jgi:hypothetical protein